MAISTSYQRPVKAELVVQLDNGESWRATDDDLEQFRLLRQAEVYQTLTYAFATASQNDNGYAALVNIKLMRFIKAAVFSQDSELTPDEAAEQLVTAINALGRES